MKSSKLHPTLPLSINKLFPFRLIHSKLFSSNSSMQERLEHQNNLIESDLKNNQLVSVEHELRDLCIQLEAHDVLDSSLSQSESISAMLQMVKMAVTNKNDLKEESDSVCEFLSEIEEAQQRVVEMSQQLEKETFCRKQSETQCVAGEAALAEAKETINSLEEDKREREADMKKLENEQESIKQRIIELDEYALSKTKEAKDLASQLEQVTNQQRKSELKWEQASSEIESCQEYLLELKSTLIEKVCAALLCDNSFIYTLT